MESSQVFRELDDALDDLDTLLKNPEVGAVLVERGINTSLALVAVDAVRHYLHGKKAEAAEDFATAAEEIRTRLLASAAAASRDDGNDGRGKPS